MWGPTQTNRYLVSVAGAGMANLISQIGASDMTGDIPETYGAEHWENPKPYIEQSPLTFIKRVKTPVLLLHGENDIRDPTGESLQYYNALKRLGVTTELAIFPRQPHGIQERKLRLQLMGKILEWLDRYLASS
jgi:dipeptidyl aminopeptidase/acylaminoacyl peptidase